MDLFNRLYIKILAKGNMFIDGKAYIINYINLVLGMFVGVGVSLLLLTPYLVSSIVIMAVTFLLFYFINTHFSSEPDMVFHISSDEPIDDLVGEIRKRFDKEDE